MKSQRANIFRFCGPQMASNAYSYLFSCSPLNVKKHSYLLNLAQGCNLPPPVLVIRLVLTKVQFSEDDFARLEALNIFLSHPFVSGKSAKMHPCN